MPAPALRTRVRVLFSDGTLFELDRDPAVEAGELIPASMVAAFWAYHRKLLVVDKVLTAATDIDPGEIRYVVEPLVGSRDQGPCPETAQN
ncbi:MAG: hypothetical protein KGR26_06935 [Cyanobacteria bacterium REEB65]|nr:hypothetical protein [Cyanobacteria bacterium REEB65]